MCRTTKSVFDKTPNVTKEMVEGISFCSAMQGLVLVDKDGKCIRRPMTYMDQRAREELKKEWLTVFRLPVQKSQNCLNI